MEFLSGFILGMFTGVSMFVAYGYYQLQRLKQAKSKITEELKKKIGELDGERESIRVRLIKAQELTQLQLELRAQAEMPSKNALHSRYKNELGQEINKLEGEKIDILRSILNDGYDPLITVLNEKGERQELPLSHFVGVAQRKQDKNSPPPPPSDSVKRVGRFTIVKGGKDDGTVH